MSFFINLSALMLFLLTIVISLSNILVELELTKQNKFINFFDSLDQSLIIHANENSIVIEEATTKNQIKVFTKNNCISNSYFVKVGNNYACANYNGTVIIPLHNNTKKINLY